MKTHLSRRTFLRTAALGTALGLAFPLVSAPDAQAQRPGPGDRPPHGPKRSTYQPKSEFSVVTVGTGIPLYSAERASACTMIQCGGRCVLVDMGNGTQARMAEMGVGLEMVDGLFLTHHHLDHNEEFPALLVNATFRGFNVQVAGPPMTQALADFTLDFYQEDMAYRSGLGGMNCTRQSNGYVRELGGGEGFVFGAMDVRTARVEHTIHAIAFRFEMGGKSVTVSGDTCYSENLVDLARGTDVLVMDSGPLRLGAPPQGAPRMRGAHPDMEELRGMAAGSGAKKLVLTHIGPMKIDEQGVREYLARSYSGEVVFASDLLEVEV